MEIISLPWALVPCDPHYLSFHMPGDGFSVLLNVFLTCHIWDQGWSTLRTTVRNNCLRPAFPCLFTTASVLSFKDYVYLNNRQINPSIHWKEMRSKGKVRFNLLLSFIPQWLCQKDNLKITNPTTDAGGSQIASHPSTDVSVLSCLPRPL